MLQLRDPERCPQCGGDSRVTDSRPHETSRKRRRACLECPHRWFTYESLIDPTHIRLKDARTS
jgi:transcriptional regulator NrdR family protein